jgi:hypothetical protein
MVALSRVPYGPVDSDDSLIRLSWRTTGELVNECRRLTAEELERLPIHMRREEVCEGRLVPYRLSVRLDGREVIEETVRGAGAREDRPLYVFREVAVPPGSYHLEVSWEGDRPADGPARLEASADYRAGEGVGDLAIDASLRLEAGDVALITYDVDRRELIAVGRGIVSTTVRR